MGELANILDFSHSPRRPVTAPLFEPSFSEPARLVPGSHARAYSKKPTRSVSLPLDLQSGSQPNFAEQLLLQFFARLQPATFSAAFFDIALISLTCWGVSRAASASWLFGTPTLGLYSLMFVLMAGRVGLYRERAETPACRYIPLFKTLLLTTTLCGLALKSSPNAKLLPLLLMSALSGCVLTASRGLRSSLHRVSGPCRNVLIIGDSLVSQRVSDVLKAEPGSTRKVKAFLQERQFRTENGPTMLRNIARKECVDEVIVAARDLDLADDMLRAARRSQLDVTFAPALEANVQLEPETIGNFTLLKVHRQRTPEWQLAAKRWLDVVLGSAMLVLVSPLLLIISLLIRFDSRGPALYASVRIGYRGRKFVCYKFRSMVLHSDAVKDALRSLNERHGAFFKISKDPRVTRVGAVLRRYSLDELPQLWNVLRGDMSLVGPRPHPADDVAAYSVEDLQRLDVVPGMTGLWQVTSRHDPSFKRCVDLDVEYIKNWSPLLDLHILAKTVSCVLKGSGV